MSKKGFTPGPWLVHPVHKNYVVPASEAHKKIGGASDPWVDREEFATAIHTALRSRRISQDEESANAHLIASAPALLEALEQAVTSMQDSGYPNGHVAVRAARTAIAAAYGKDQ